jgi:anti-sigma B factor antagonist
MSVPAKFEYSVEILPPANLLLYRLSGTMDPLAAEEFQRVLNKAIDSGTQRIILDLEQLRYVGSVGLQIFVAVNNRLKANGWFGLVRPSPDVRQLLDLTRISQRIPIYATPEDAIDAARTR